MFQLSPWTPCRWVSACSGGDNATDLHGSPRLLEWTGAELDFVDVGSDPDDITAAIELAERPELGPNPVYRKACGDVAERAVSAEMGIALFEMIDHPSGTAQGSGNLNVEGCADRTGNRNAARLVRRACVLPRRTRPGVPPQVPGRLVGRNRPPRGRIGRRVIARRCPGFGGGARGQPFIPLEPGAVTVLFGKNGAGKTLVINSTRPHSKRSPEPIERGAPAEARTPLRPAAAGTLAGSGSRYVAGPPPHRLEPLAPIDGPAQRELNQLLPAWSAIEKKPESADGLSPDQLAALSLDELRDALVTAVASKGEFGDSPHTRNLLTAMFTSPVVVWAADASASLAVLPAELDGSLAGGAQRLLDQLTTMSGTGLKAPADFAMLELARALSAAERPNRSRSARHQSLEQRSSG